jgi:hypothetical protein
LLAEGDAWAGVVDDAVDGVVETDGCAEDWLTVGEACVFAAVPVVDGDPPQAATPRINNAREGTASEERTIFDMDKLSVRANAC